MEARLAEIAEVWTTNEKLLVGAERVAKILSSFMAVWSVFSTAVRFREPIPVPLAIDAGRHMGLGLFAAE